ncbi:tripartite tricarboxylate transporter substrate binding protein [Rhizobium sp. YS-1r]|uniref:Bug family tripartite tricarboxylate transporter substrate binding protein n=1 Tax=Rhizobium sp. YS-1r TaxID=1532558 RepID=UPI00069117A4|nr:tripartite tricarboxylate transporter substrate binding protein [Rhizobium sp. YS-1r]
MNRFLASALALMITACLSAGGARAAEDNYPSRQITLIAGFPAGSGADVYARFFAKKLEEALKQTVIVENKPGGLGSLSVVALKNAKPDGYTMLIGSADQFTAAPHVFQNPPYDPLKDFDYVAPVFSQAFMMLVNAKSPYMHISDLTKAMKEKGDKASYATPNFPATILAEMYKANAGGLDTLQVRYKTSADTLNDFSSGAIDYMVGDPVFGLARSRDGTLRILAVSTAKRISSVPDIPTFEEEGVPNVDVRIWWVLAAPKGTPKPILEKMHKVMTEVTTSDDARKFVGTNGGEPMTLDSPQATLDYATMDVKRWEEWAKIGKIEKQ